MKFDDLSTLIDTTTLSKERLKEMNAKPTKIALWNVRGKLTVVAIYWEAEGRGAWDDENAMSMTNLILDLPTEDK